MELDGIVELGKLVHLTDQEMDTIRFLLPHYCLFENGNRKIPMRFERFRYQYHRKKVFEPGSITGKKKNVF